MKTEKLRSSTAEKYTNRQVICLCLITLPSNNTQCTKLQSVSHGHRSEEILSDAIDLVFP